MSDMDTVGREEFFEHNPQARAWAELDAATRQQNTITPPSVQLSKRKMRGKRALVIGSGVAGLSTAYELLAQDCGVEVTVLEAANRTGGRCLSLRTGDTLTEDQDSELWDSPPGETQVVRFKRPVGDREPYLNAGPGRIPSAHKRLLSYLKKFGVDIEIYVMNSESNLVHLKKSPTGDKPLVYRRLNHNTRGWLAEMVHENAKLLVESTSAAEGKSEDEIRKLAKKLKSLMVSFGELNSKGKYVQTAGDDGEENGSTRAGYTVLPGVDAGETADPIGMEDLLNSEFWKKVRFYQPVDFLWQPSLFQPVGGMDQVQHALAQQVAALGGTVHLNSPVKSIDWNAKKKHYVVKVSQIGTDKTLTYHADYVFSNVAIPFLERMLSSRLQGRNGLFLPKFRECLKKVYHCQKNPVFDKKGNPRRFLANTTKVGWQADRKLWQGSPVDTCDRKHRKHLGVQESEVGVVPIFGGISWSQSDIVQIWYPSNAYHDEKGVLTGAYNFGETARKWGFLSVDKRLNKARKCAANFGEAFAKGLHDGVAIAWQNMPHIKGGWAQWDVLGADATHCFNTLAQGTGVTGARGEPSFFIVGDQMSSLPGWQEGAIASALNALSRVSNPKRKVPHLSCLPDTRLMVEGV